MQSRYQLSLGLGRSIPWTNYLRNSNMPRSSGAWTSDVARKSRRRWLLSRLAPYSATVDPCSPNPDRPSDVCFNLENNEDEMDLELGKLKSSSAVTGLNTPGQQCPPNEGIREIGKTTASGILTTGAGPSRGENISSTERATRMVTVADISSIAATPSKRRHKTFSEENKHFDPVGRGEKAPPWNAAVPLPFFFWGEAGRLLVCLSGAKLGGFLYVLSMPCMCVCFSEIVFLFTGETHPARRFLETRTSRWCTQSEDKRFLAYYPIWRWRGQATPGLIVAQTL